MVGIEVNADGGRCPTCGGATERVHRDVVDRWVSLFRSVHRYRCTNPGCGWHGLLGRDPPSVTAARWPLWRGRLLWLLIGAGLALAAVQGMRMVERSRHAAAREQQQAVASQSMTAQAGLDFDGEALPATDERVAGNPSPLSLRRSCAWGVPGGNRYRGTVQQALAAARLPAEVVREIGEQIDRGWTRGQVEISRTGIRTVDKRRFFGTSALAMGFGNTLCFDTRVNFKPGHVEYGGLYEATDRKGRVHTVMVPYVCQNVAVLGERGEAEVNGHNGHNGNVAEPASWTVAALGLGLLAAARWHHARSTHD